MKRSYRVRPVTVDRAAAAAAAAGVIGRRLDLDPDHPVPDAEDLGAVVDHVHRHRQVRADVLAEDALAQLAILNHLAGELDRQRLYAIRLARSTGATWRAIAGELGLGSPQSAEQTWLRLESLFGGEEHRRDEAAGRELRRRPRQRAAPVVAARAQGGSGDPVLLELRAALEQLVAVRELLPEDVADDVLDVQHEVGGRRAALSRDELGNWLKALVVNPMRGGQWPAAVQAALDRVVAALAR